ncbi:MAG TPA: polysaccharide pyruvyl transferase family protein [Paludibacter sp.]
MNAQKKIGILTTPLYVNYGGILQAYALQKYLNRLGYEAYLINLKFKEPSLFQKIIRLIKIATSKYIFSNRNASFINSDFTTKQRRIVSKQTSKFIDIHIQPKTLEIKGVKNISQILKCGFDVYIVGSDQVWRPLYCNVNTYFLDFLITDNTIKRIVYAASFGVDVWEYTKEETEICKVLARKFNAVSVREYSGIDLCKKYLNIDAIHLIDPTMLLTEEDYSSLIIKEKTKSDLLVYLLDYHSEKDQLINKISSYFGYKPFSSNNAKTEDPHFSAKERIAPSVESWLNGFKTSKYVITDSFHGTVFSILFHVPFIVCGNKKRGMARFISLLQKFGLENRLIYSDNDLTIERIIEPIKWDQIDKVLQLEREKSFNFLINNII